IPPPLPPVTAPKTPDTTRATTNATMTATVAATSAALHTPTLHHLSAGTPEETTTHLAMTPASKTTAPPVTDARVPKD
ncbi:hypothetical protein LTR33_012521, partial [Friedmanniomyces endolithicus]